MAMSMAEKKQNNISSVVSNYSNRLYNFIRGKVSTNVEAEDILQDVWFQLSNVLDLDSIEQVSGWLFRVARNRITDNYRKKKEQSLDALTFEDDEGNELSSDVFLAEFPSPEDENLKELFWEELFQALEELPEDQKNVFIWNELEDMTLQQISDKTNVNIKTLISRKRYAVIHLRKRLTDLYTEFMEY